MQPTTRVDLLSSTPGRRPALAVAAPANRGQATNGHGANPGRGRAEPDRTVGGVSEDGFPNDVSGDFEIHITVYERNTGELADFAGEHGLKYTHVVLDRGEKPSQPMLT